MKVTRRQSVLAMATVLGGTLIRALPLRLLAWRSEAAGDARASGEAVRRRVEPDPHSVKRHG